MYFITELRNQSHALLVGLHNLIAITPTYGHHIVTGNTFLLAAHSQQSHDSTSRGFDFSFRHNIIYYAVTFLLICHWLIYMYFRLFLIYGWLGRGRTIRRPMRS